MEAKKLKAIMQKLDTLTNEAMARAKIAQGKGEQPDWQLCITTATESFAAAMQYFLTLPKEERHQFAKKRAEKLLRMKEKIQKPKLDNFVAGISLN